MSSVSKPISHLMIKILKQFFAFAILVVLASSCIPNEKVIYLQNKKLIPRLDNDSIISLNRVEYRLQPNDILLINCYSAVEVAVQKFYPIFARPYAARGLDLRGNSVNAAFNIQSNAYLYTKLKV